MPDAESEARLKPMLAYSFGSLPTGFLLLAVTTWLMRLYCPTADEEGRVLLVSPAVFGIASSVVMLLAAVVDPLVGYFSDRSRNPAGRRLPFMKWGLPCLSFLLIWFPPVQGESDLNVVWLVVMFGLLQVSFTLVVNPYLALMPEVWRSDGGRIRVSAWMAAFNAVAQIVGFVLFGVLISTVHDGGSFLGLFEWDGFKIAALISFVLTVLGFLPTLFWIKETPHCEDKEVSFGLIEAGWQTLRNPAFLPYIGAGAMLFAAQYLIVMALPFLVVAQIVDDPAQGDMVASLMLLGLVLFTALLYPVAVKLSERLKKRDLMMLSLGSFVIVLPLVTFTGQIPFVPAMLHLGIACALIAPGLAVGMVIPRAILADVMDFDAQRTGFRREAMYNGMEGLLQKIAGGLAPLVQGLLFTYYGNTREEPWGIVLCGVAGGVLALLGMIAFWFYPLEK
ncbi:MAG: MFS transporter [Deltaproteobacteria bacterium]|nr:MFS transporter [Deltaproteobacteria bacterium]